MKRTRIHLEVAGALLFSLAAASVLTTATPYRTVLAGLAASTSLLLIRSAERSSRREGRTDLLKAVMVSGTVLYELVLLLGISSLAIVPKFLSAITLATVAFSEILKLELEQNLKVSFTPDIGREGRVVALVVSLLAYVFNPYFLFYGLSFVALLAVYDSMRYMHRLRDRF